MGTPIQPPPWRHAKTPLSGVSRGLAAFTLVDSVVAMALLAVVSISVTYGLTRTNWSAAADRNRSAAQALCQERLEQALVVTYNPPRHVPAVFGSVWPIPSTSTETLVDEELAIFADETDPAGTRVTGKRRCIVERLENDLVRFTVRVEWNFRGRAYRSELHTLRAPDTLR